MLDALKANLLSNVEDRRLDAVSQKTESALVELTRILGTLRMF